MQARAVVEEFSIEQIVPYFQAIFDLNNQKVARYECLSRLITSKDIVHLPSEFLYIIKREQSNAQLTQRMFELSSAYCNNRNMPWSINMFTTDLRDATLMTWMQSLFADVKDGLVGVELSYDSVKHHPHLLHNLIEKLPQLHVSIDDAYECSNELKQVLAAGVHAIKLRGQLITEYVESQAHKQSIEEIIEACRAQKCILVAEHIESEATLDAVATLGIQYGQGFYLSEPQGRMSSLKQV